MCRKNNLIQSTDKIRVPEEKSMIHANRSSEAVLPYLVLAYLCN